MLWRGWVDEANPGFDAEYGDIVTLECIDAKGEVGRVDIAAVDPPVGAGESIQARLDRIADAAGWADYWRNFEGTGVTVVGTELGGQAADLLNRAADSGGGSLFGDVDGKLRYRNRDWQLWPADEYEDGTIGNVAPGYLDEVVLAEVAGRLRSVRSPARSSRRRRPRRLRPVRRLRRRTRRCTATRPAPACTRSAPGYRATTARRRGRWRSPVSDITTRVLIGRPDMDEPIVLDDDDAQDIYGVETLDLTDLETTSRRRDDPDRQPAARHPRPHDDATHRRRHVERGDRPRRRRPARRPPTRAPRHGSVAATSPASRQVFNRLMFCTAVRHTIGPDMWEARLSLDDAMPWQVGGDSRVLVRHRNRRRRPLAASRRGRRTSHHEEHLMATIPGVSDGELIRTTWGDAVADELNGELIRRNGGDADDRRPGPAYRQSDRHRSCRPQRLCRRQLQGTTGGTINGHSTSTPRRPTTSRRPFTGHRRRRRLSTPRKSPYSNTGSPLRLRPGQFGRTADASAAGDVTLTAGGGQIYCSDQVRCLAAMFGTGASRFVRLGGDVSLAGPSNTTYLSFHGAASNVDSIGGRSGYVGYTDDSALRLENQAASGSIYFDHRLRCRVRRRRHRTVRRSRPPCSSARPPPRSAPREPPSPTTGRCTRRSPVVPSATTPTSNATGSAASTVNVRRVPRATGPGSDGSSRPAPPAPPSVVGSDYRMKTVVGPIDNAVDRIKALKPYRVPGTVTRPRRNRRVPRPRGPAVRPRRRHPAKRMPSPDHRPPRTTRPKAHRSCKASSYDKLSP